MLGILAEEWGHSDSGCGGTIIFAQNIINSIALYCTSIKVGWKEQMLFLVDENSQHVEHNGL